MVNMINVICHNLLHQDSQRRLVEQHLIDSFRYEVGNWEYPFANELYRFLERTGHKESIIMTKEDLLDYYKSYDTSVYQHLSFILTKVDDKDKVEITTESWF